MKKIEDYPAKEEKSNESAAAVSVIFFLSLFCTTKAKLGSIFSAMLSFCFESLVEEDNLKNCHVFIVFPLSVNGALC